MKEMKETFKTIVKTIENVEEKYRDQKAQGKTKKQEVVDTINAVVDIPIIPEILEEKIFSLIIDLVVFIFNNYIWRKAV